jgi:autotransporter-associated beta strand protein
MPSSFNPPVFFAMKTSCASHLVRFFWLLPCLLLAAPATAATLYWDGAATTVNSQSDNATTAGRSWLNGGNWDNGSTSAPVASWTAGNAAVFGGTAASQTITAGTLTAGNLTFGQGPLGAGSAGTAYTLTGGTLTLSNSTITANTATTISSTLAGATGFIKRGAGSLTLGAANSLTGSVTLSQGTLGIGNTTAAGSGSIILGDANTGANNVQLTLNAGSIANSIVVANQGSGTITLYAASQYGSQTGTTTLARDTIFQTYDAAGSDWWYEWGVIAGAGKVTFKAGVEPHQSRTMLSRTNTYIGTTTIAQGRMQIQNAAAFGNSGNELNLQGTGQLNLRVDLGIGALTGSGAGIFADVASTLTLGNGGGSGTFSGSLFNNAAVLSLTKVGAGTQTFTSASTYTGTTTVAAGTLLINGSIAASATTVATGATLGGTGTSAGTTTVNGTLAPGANGIGTLTVNNTVTLTASATTLMEIKSAAGVTTADKVRGMTTVTYGGTLTVTRDPSSSDFGAGDQFVLFSATTYAGTFSTLNLPALTGILTWDTSRLKTDGSIAVVTPGISSPPVFNPPAGGYIGAQTVTLTAASGAMIYYTTDGSPPTASSPHATSPVTGIAIPADATRTLNAYAVVAGNASSPVASATYVTVGSPTWVTAGGGSWLVGTNWQSGVIATGASGMTADFSKTNLTADALVTLDAARTLGSLYFGDSVPSHNWTLATGSAGVLTLDTASGTPTVGVANQTTTISAVLAGTKGLVKNGAGMLVLSAANTYGGLTTVSAGTLEVLAKSGDAGYAVAQGATLKLGYSTGGGYAGTLMQITGNGVAATTGLYLKGGSSYNAAGGMTILTAPSTIRQYGSGYASLGSFDINDNGLSIEAAASGSVIDGNIQIVSRGYGMSVNTAAGAATATGDLVINGPLNVTLAQTGITLGFYKRGTGSVRLNAPASADNMGVQIQAGSIITGINHAIGNSASLGISSGAKLVLNGFNQSAGVLSGAGGIVGGAATPATLTITQTAANTFSGILGGPAVNDNNLALTKLGAAMLTLSGVNTYTGGSTITVGTLKLDLSARSGGMQVGAFAIGASGTLEVAGGTNTGIDNKGFELNSVFTGTGTITKTGIGYFSLFVPVGFRDFAGLIDIQQGVLGNNSSGWGSGAGLMDLNITAGAVLDLRTGNVNIDALSGSGTIYKTWTTASTLTIGNNNGSASFSGSINPQAGAAAGGSPPIGVVSLTKNGSGTQTLSGANTHTGATSVTAGTLLINGSVASSPVTVAAAAALGGTGTLGGAVLVNGTLAPGSNGIGELTINNSLSLAATAKALMEISKSGGTATFDRVRGVTSLTMGGTLTLTTSGEALLVGESFRLFVATTYGGTFSSINLPTGYVWDTSQLTTNGTVAVTSINHPPVFGGYAVAAPYQKPLSLLCAKLLAKAGDPDGDALAATAAGPTSANGGTALMLGSSILYTPANNFSGADSFPVSITDAHGATVVGTVTVTVGAGPGDGGAGANPPVLTRLPDGKLGLAFQGIPGRSYMVQRSVDGLANWLTLATVAADASGKVSFTDDSPPAGSAFYRLGLP